MGRKSKMAVLKRQRELKKAEKAALKREKRAQREETPPQSHESQVATRTDLEGYGVDSDSEDDPKR